MTPERLARLDRVLARRQPDLTVLAENLHKPRNFSAIIRTCDAVGIYQVHAVPGEFHPRRHWHTSSGSEKWVELRIHPDTESAAGSLKADGMQLLAAHVSDSAVDYRAVDYTQATALMLGTELFGVSEQALQYADQQIIIPMEGMSRSLNVSVACALVLYEAHRQRSQAGMYREARLDARTRARLRFEWLHPQVAAFCRDKDHPYPPLDEAGNIIGAVPRA